MPKKEPKPHADLLPPREALSLLNPDPSSYTSLLGDPTAAGAGGVDPSAGAADAASSTAGSTHDLADAQAAGNQGQPVVSDQPQTISTDDTQTASSET
jgi:hypothetical protein